MRRLTYTLLAVILTACQTAPTTDVATANLAPRPPPLFFPGPGQTLQWTAYTSTTTFTVPPNVKGYSTLGCSGGGGGAAGVTGATGGGLNHAGGGGGGGSQLQPCYLTVAPSDSITVTIGTGGAGGLSSNTAGVHGTVTHINDTTSGAQCYFTEGSGGTSDIGDSVGLFPSAGGSPTTSRGANLYVLTSAAIPGAGGTGGTQNSNFIFGPVVGISLAEAFNGSDAIGFGASVGGAAAGGLAGTTGTTSGSQAGGFGGGGGGAGGGIGASGGGNAGAGGNGREEYSGV